MVREVRKYASIRTSDLTEVNNLFIQCHVAEQNSIFKTKLNYPISLHYSFIYSFNLINAKVACTNYCLFDIRFKLIY